MRLPSLSKLLRKPLASLAAVAALALPAQATWSVVVMDLVTGEVVLASATCLSNANLAQVLGSVVVGKGAGACQSFVFQQGKSIISDGLKAGKTPAEILADIHQADTSPELRQYGIVGLEGPAATFTGSGAGLAASGVTGDAGNLRFAIQGNVLTGDEVVTAARDALLATEGDLGQKAMAAMLAAAALGGDGRCSCVPANPTGCGVPPPSFTHSAFSSFIIIARPGDLDSTTCGVSSNNCTNGIYYGKLTFQGNINKPDPVRALDRKFQVWRSELAGRPDHFLTEVYNSSQRVKADGVDTTTIDILLRDVDGDPLVNGGQTVLVAAIENPGVTILPAVDNGDGTHTLTVVGGTNPGRVQLRLLVNDGGGNVRLWPDVEFEVAPPTALFANQSGVSVSEGGQVRFEIDVPANAGGPYHLLGSVSGTHPGTPFGSLVLPLNADRLLRMTVLRPNSAVLVNTQGTLDGSGQATAWVDVSSGYFDAYIGLTGFFTAFLAGSPDQVTNVASFEMLP